jgi:hypothetical protein
MQEAESLTQEAGNLLLSLIAKGTMTVSIPASPAFALHDGGFPVRRSYSPYYKLYLPPGYPDSTAPDFLAAGAVSTVIRCHQLRARGEAKCEWHGRSGYNCETIAGCS